MRETREIRGIREREEKWRKGGSARARESENEGEKRSMRESFFFLRTLFSRLSPTFSLSTLPHLVFLEELRNHGREQASAHLEHRPPGPGALLGGQARCAPLWRKRERERERERAVWRERGRERRDAKKKKNCRRRPSSSSSPFRSVGGGSRYPRGGFACLCLPFFLAHPQLPFAQLSTPKNTLPGSIPDTDDGVEDEETMDFSDAASGGEESSGGGTAAGGVFSNAPPPRRSSLPTLAEDSVGGGSRSSRTRSPSPSVNTLAGGGSRTASGIEGGSAGIFNLQQQQQQHPSSSGERERGGGGGGGSERGGGGAFAAGLAGGNNNAPTPPPPLYYSHHPSHHRGQGFSLSPLSHSG